MANRPPAGRKLDDAKARVNRAKKAAKMNRRLKTNENQNINKRRLSKVSKKMPKKKEIEKGVLMMGFKMLMPAPIKMAMTAGTIEKKMEHAQMKKAAKAKAKKEKAAKAGK